MNAVETIRDEAGCCSIKLRDSFQKSSMARVAGNELLIATALSSSMSNTSTEPNVCEDLCHWTEMCPKRAGNIYGSLFGQTSVGFMVRIMLWAVTKKPAKIVAETSMGKTQREGDMSEKRISQLTK